jgi:rare lipoprotein A
MSMRLLFSISLTLGCCFGALAAEQSAPSETKSDVAQPPRKLPADRSGKPRKGKVSYYSHKLSGKVMADGTKMNPKSNAAASKTLPLGTIARVTNLRNGKSAVVEIKDRGPYVKGRIVDVSPTTADKLEIRSKGTAPVEVAPIEMPQPDGGVDSARPPSALSR